MGAECNKNTPVSEKAAQAELDVGEFKLARSAPARRHNRLVYSWK